MKQEFIALPSPVYCALPQQGRTSPIASAAALGRADATETGERDPPGGDMRTDQRAYGRGEQIADRYRLSDAVRPTSEIYVMQALSGG